MTENIAFQLQDFVTRGEPLFRAERRARVFPAFLALAVGAVVAVIAT